MPDQQLLTQVAQFYGFPDIEFVNKDFYVVEVLKMLSTIQPDVCDFIFSGGTCLSKAYNLIERMSEDVDIKVRLQNNTMSAGVLRKTLSKTKHQIEIELKKMFPRFSETDISADHGNRHIAFNITYPAVRETPVLRNGIKLELTQSTIRLVPIAKPISSLITTARKNHPDIAEFLCVDPLETLAEKIVALLRRICARLETGKQKFDPALIRHVYDIQVIYSKIDTKKLVPLAREIIQQDAESYRTWHPKWSADPAVNTKLALAELKQNEYADMFEKYTKVMIYARKIPKYSEALKTVAEIAENIF
ncbi:MAG: nucleotidyl transferase AbiEii/AbiGii toxin family protein [Candidatus Margulisbacteria bacterium]|jgi:predicted nucleotidyltransferase component of viral defense system|nr:nucleotidyl transferase AbiEii/AbiGii toxin family protein [Candidatus Margulisiibacteriota bacterium]